MNDTALKDFLTPIGDGSSWAAKCVRRLLEAENLTEIAEGLVAQNGQKPVERIKDVWNAWGIDMETCHAYCARQNFPMVFVTLTSTVKRIYRFMDLLPII